MAIATEAPITKAVPGIFTHTADVPKSDSAALSNVTDSRGEKLVSLYFYFI